MSTLPTASSEIGRRLACRSRSEEKKAAEYSSGGSRIRKTRSGGSSTSGAPGRKPRPAPPTTSAIGYGIRRTSASTISATTATRTPNSSSSTSALRELRDRQRGGALAAPDEAHPLAGRRLDVDAAQRHADGLGQALAHRVAVRPEL